MISAPAEIGGLVQHMDVVLVCVITGDSVHK